jgi:hypothetical protein
MYLFTAFDSAVHKVKWCISSRGDLGLFVLSLTCFIPVLETDSCLNCHSRLFISKSHFHSFFHFYALSFPAYAWCFSTLHVYLSVLEWWLLQVGISCLSLPNTPQLKSHLSCLSLPNTPQLKSHLSCLSLPNTPQLKSHLSCLSLPNTPQHRSHLSYLSLPSPDHFSDNGIRAGAVSQSGVV